MKYQLWRIILAVLCIAAPPLAPASVWAAYRGYMPCTSVSNPVNGDICSDSTSNTLERYNGTAWTAIQGSGGGIFPQTLTPSTPSGGTQTATMAVHSATSASIDINYVTPAANITIATPPASGIADGDEMIVPVITTGTAYTVSFVVGTGVTLASAKLGENGLPPASTCMSPGTGEVWYDWRYQNTGSGTGTLTLMDCKGTPPGVNGVAAGGTGANSVSGWAIGNTVITTVSSPTTLSVLPNMWTTNQDVILGANTSIVIAPPSAVVGGFGQQVENFRILQSGSGGFVPTFTLGTGLTLLPSTNTFPPVNTAAGSITTFQIYFDSTTTGYVVSNSGGGGGGGNLVQICKLTGTNNGTFTCYQQVTGGAINMIANYCWAQNYQNTSATAQVCSFAGNGGFSYTLGGVIMSNVGPPGFNINGSPGTPATQLSSPVSMTNTVDNGLVWTLGF